MTRHIILGNGSLLACFDKHNRIRDFYFPHVGQENHVSSNRHLTGVWVDGRFSWVSRDEWDITMRYREDCLVSEVIAYHQGLSVELKINEAVHPEKNILVRKVSVTNKASHKRVVKVFFSQHFHISETDIGDTVYFDPMLHALIHYKGKRYFLMGGMHGQSKRFFDDYATGNAEASEKQGTWMDAHDGSLSKNPIEHGAVDSTLGFSLDLDADKTKEVDYWIAIGKRHHEVHTLQDFIKAHGCKKLLDDTAKYWKKWVDIKKMNFHNLSREVKDLFKRSLLIIRAQTNHNGAIIAANDTHTFHMKKDTYSYMWPRDGALVARSLDRVGHHDITTKFFEFCSTLITSEGYFLHKYRPDGSFGSSWHSWLRGDSIQLPIQEDETALILDALWKHFKDHQEDGKIKKMYKSFIKPMGDFLVEYRDPDTKLPKESYDLWEEKLGVHTFTACTVYAGLMAAKKFADVFGSKVNASKYERAAHEVREAILKFLYDKDSEMFVKGIYFDRQCEDGCEMKLDKTIDSSTAYALFEYEVLHVDDPRLSRTVGKTINTLWNTHGCGGMIRYQDDKYYQTTANAPANPWFISTLWLAEYHIAKAKNLEELKRAQTLISWCVDKKLTSGVLSEQINPVTGEHLSVAPLTWSHAGFVIAVVKYIDKYEELSKKS